MKSPEVMRVWETDTKAKEFKCDACDYVLHKDAPVLYVDEVLIICIGCIRWAIPQMEELEEAE